MTRPIIDALIAFEGELQAFGLHVKGGVVCDGKVHRCTDTNHHRRTNDAGWYVVRELDNGLLVGNCGSWLEGRGSISWNSRGDTYAKLSAADRDAIAENRAKADAEKRHVAHQAAQDAAREWAKAKPCSSHPYLSRKDVQSHGLRIDAAGRLLIPLSDLGGNLRSLQRIAPENVPDNKKFLFGTDRSTALAFILGCIEGAQRVVIVEGYATGATIHEVTGLPVIVAFDAGGVKRIASMVRTMLPEAELIFAGDHDRKERGGAGQKAARIAANETGGIAFCPPTEGHDWNDHAKEFGREDVRLRFKTITDPTEPPSPGLPLQEAREKLAKLTRDTVEGLLSFDWSRGLDTPPPAALIAASLGLGKTREALIVALGLIDKGLRPVVVATPTHALNQQHLDDARSLAAELGVNARIEMRLGREALDPDAPGQTMCTNLDPVRDVTKVGLDAQGTVCERKIKVEGPNGQKSFQTIRCPVFEAGECAYQKQRQKRADLWLVSHAALGHTRPAEIDHPALLIVDENPLSAMLRGTGALPAEWISIGMADLAPNVHTSAGSIDKVRTAALEADFPELVALRRKMRAVRDANGVASIKPEAMADITPEELRQAGGQSKSRIVHPDIMPGMTTAQRRELLKPAAGNKARLHEAKLYELLASFLETSDGTPSGHVSIATYQDTAKNTHEVWRLTYLTAIKGGWQAPTIILDATARPDYRPITRQMFPGLCDDLGGEVKASTPHRRIVVGLGRGMTKQAIETNPKGRALEAATYVATERRRLGGDAVIFGNKILTDQIHADFPTVDAAHFNALRGRNDWRRHSIGATFGRPMPSPRAVEIMAGAITGRAVDPLGEDERYERTTRTLTVAGKVVGSIDGVRHPDPVAEAVRWSICEGEILQSDRLRAAERTADTRAEWHLIGCPVPDELVIDEVRAWRPATPEESMLALGGVALSSASAAARAYPDLWPTAKAAQKAFLRSEGQMETKSYRNNYKGMSPSGLATFTYQLAGARQRPAKALVDVGIVADPRAWLETRLGELAFFEADQADAPTPIDRPTVTTRYSHAELAQLARPPPEATAPIVPDPPASISLTIGLDVNAAPLAPLDTDLTGAFTISATAIWPEAMADNIAPAWSDYAGGIMPADLSAFVRAAWRASGLTQQQLADLAGISRPQIANALQGRFGLSVDAAARLRAALSTLPPPSQGALL
jgi:putative DNA primase/helicase